MSEPILPPPPPSTVPPAAAPPAKKGGMPTWGWFAIGCGLLLLLVLVGLGAGCWWLGNKAKDFAENPELASIKLIAAADPDIELVESDADAGTATLRNLKTGEVIEVDFDDIREGKIRWTVDGKETSYELDEEAGSIRFETEGEDGVQTAEIGRGETPGWVPVYPGAGYQGGFRTSTGDRASGTASYATRDSVDAVITHYRQWMEGQGMEITTSDVTSGGETIRSIQGSEQGRSLTVTVTKSGTEPTQIGVVFDGPK